MVENNEKKIDLEKEKRLKNYEEQKKKEEKISNQAFEIMGRATESVKTNNFDEALKLYNEAIELLKEIHWTNQIQTLQKTISELEIKRTHYLQGIEKQEARELKQRKLEAKQVILQEEQARKKKDLEEKRLTEYEERKKREEEISNQAYNLIEKASKMVKNNEFDKALEFYSESLDLFKEIKWIHEIQTMQNTINRVKAEKEYYLRELEEKRVREENERILKAEREAQLEEKARKIKEREEQERAEKIAALDEEKEFKRHITEMGEEADKIVRDYEIEIKKGNFDLEPTYEKAIEIYRNLHKMLLEKNWNEQAQITLVQIKHLKNKLEQDKKLREIEVDKIRKHQEYLESLKFKKKEVDMSEFEMKRKAEQDFQNEINKIMNEADKIAREYKMSIKKGNFVVPCPYPDIIKKYKNLRSMLKEKDWEGQIDIVNRQIKYYNDFLEKDKKLREIEAQKIQKQKEYEEHLKVKKD